MADSPEDTRKTREKMIKLTKWLEYVVLETHTKRVYSASQTNTVSSADHFRNLPLLSGSH